MTNDFDNSSDYIGQDRLEALIRLGYDFTDWNERLEYAE